MGTMVRVAVDWLVVSAATMKTAIAKRNRQSVTHAPTVSTDAALGKLDQLQAVSEGQYDTLISTVRSAMNDIKQSAVDAGDAFAAARQERQDAVQRLAQNLGPMKQRLDQQCSPAG
jgi:hypothetical protein